MPDRMIWHFCLSDADGFSVWCIKEIKQEKEGTQSGFGQEDSLERKRVFGEFRFRFLAFQLNRRIFAGIFSVSVFFV